MKIGNNYKYSNKNDLFFVEIINKIIKSLLTNKF